jgi:hypothetical protein
MDLLFGDWDRHEDQYQWARFDRGDVRVWRAIPRDRDYVFVDYDGALVRAAGGLYPKAVLYGPSYPGTLYGSPSTRSTSTGACWRTSPARRGTRWPPGSRRAFPTR